MRRHMGAGLVAAALLLLAAPAGATGPGANGKLIYSVGNGVVVSDADGSSATNVLSGTGYYSPVWSPDGSRFVVELSGDIWSFDASGLNPTHITSDGFYDESPAWSPDGTKVVFGRILSDREAIYSASAAGGSLKKLSKPPAGKYDFSPAWSPDGRKIAFNRDKAHGHQSYDIWTMNADGSSPKLFLLNSLFNAYPAWSPDSKRLVYEQKANKKIVLQTRTAAGKDMKQLTTSTSYEPEYSPDGRFVLYQDGKGHVMKVSVNGGTPVQLVSLGYSPSWQPACNQTTPPEGGTLTGTAKPELLCGGAGPDTVNAAGGNDHVFTYGDADTLNGKDGNDVLAGGDSNDTFNGGPGTDVCVQGEGSGTKTACEK